MAIKIHSAPIIMATAIYGLSFLMLFTFSTMYHPFGHSATKNVLEVLDHIGIYFFIAGTYTPIIIKYMNNSTGILLLWLLWLIVLLGTTFKICIGCRYNILSTILYVLMGWMLLFTGNSFSKEMPDAIIVLVIKGGILYSIGVVFYLWQKLKWGHVIWHAFVICAALYHYFAIYNSL